MNLAAAIISVSEFEQAIRLTGMVAALVYTIVKIVQTVKEIKRDDRKEMKHERKVR